MTCWGQHCWKSNAKSNKTIAMVRCQVKTKLKPLATMKDRWSSCVVGTTVRLLYRRHATDVDTFVFPSRSHIDARKETALYTRSLEREKLQPAPAQQSLSKSQLNTTITTGESFVCVRALLRVFFVCVLMFSWLWYSDKIVFCSALFYQASTIATITLRLVCN